MKEDFSDSFSSDLAPAPFHSAAGEGLFERWPFWRHKIKRAEPACPPNLAIAIRLICVAISASFPELALGRFSWSAGTPEMREPQARTLLNTTNGRFTFRIEFGALLKA